MKNLDAIFKSLLNQKVNCGRKTWQPFTNYSTRTTFLCQVGLLKYK